MFWEAKKRHCGKILSKTRFVPRRVQVSVCAKAHQNKLTVRPCGGIRQYVAN